MKRTGYKSGKNKCVNAGCAKIYIVRDNCGSWSGVADERGSVNSVQYVLYLAFKTAQGKIKSVSNFQRLFLRCHNTYCRCLFLKEFRLSFVSFNFTRVWSLVEIIREFGHYEIRLYRIEF